MKADLFFLFLSDTFGLYIISFSLYKHKLKTKYKIMSYLKFDKTLMTNLEESLPREILRTNRSGAYHCTTIADCNTRKYHGLLVIPVPELDDEKMCIRDRQSRDTHLYRTGWRTFLRQTFHARHVRIHAEAYLLRRKSIKTV